MSQQKHEEIRANVSDAYGKAVSKPSDGGCCGTVQKGTVVKLAGYDPDELRDLPPEAVVNSFGCGNPLAFSEIQAGDVVLDLGSGAGIDILMAAKQVGPAGRAIGIDMTDEMIAKARGNIATSGLTNAEVRKGIIEDLPVDSDRSLNLAGVLATFLILMSQPDLKYFVQSAENRRKELVLLLKTNKGESR